MQWSEQVRAIRRVGTLDSTNRLHQRAFICSIKTIRLEIHVKHTWSSANSFGWWVQPVMLHGSASVKGSVELDTTCALHSQIFKYWIYCQAKRWLQTLTNVSFRMMPPIQMPPSAYAAHTRTQFEPYELPFARGYMPAAGLHCIIASLSYARSTRCGMLIVCI